MEWGDPVASSWITIVPVREPGAVGVKVIANVQLPAAGTLVPQLSVSAKSPVAVIDVIERDALPRLRRSTFCGWLVVPIVWLAYCNEAGLKEAAGEFPAPIFRMNASVFPPSTL